MKKTVAMLLAILVSTPAWAQDHLYPEPSVYGGDLFMPAYHNEVAGLLKEAMEPEVILRMIEVPSFVPESAVGVRQRQGRYEIFALQPSEPVWDYQRRHPEKNGEIRIKPDGNLDYSASAPIWAPITSTIPVSRCAIPISQDLASTLSIVWARALMAVRYDSQREMGADGANFHFAMRKGHVFMAGEVWSPAPSTSTGMLAGVAVAMRDYCMTKSPTKRGELARQAEALLGMQH